MSRKPLIKTEAWLSLTVTLSVPGANPMVLSLELMVTSCVVVPNGIVQPGGNGVSEDGAIAILKVSSSSRVSSLMMVIGILTARSLGANEMVETTL